jgi:hypothetical protein
MTSFILNLFLENSMYMIHMRPRVLARWSRALTHGWEGTRSIPNPGTLFPTLRIWTSPFCSDLAGRLGPFVA